MTFLTHHQATPARTPPWPRRTTPLVPLARGWAVTGTWIRRRGSGFAVIAYAGRDPASGKRRYKWWSGFATRREAEQFRATLAHSPIHGAGGVSRARLRDYLPAWAETRAGLRGWRDKTRETTALMIAHLTREIGHMPLSRLSPAAIEAALLRIAARTSPATARRAAETLSTAMADAQRLGLILRNPCEQAAFPRAEEREPVLLSSEQVARYLEDARQTATPAVYALWVVMIACGLRLGELLGLREEDVSLDGPLPTLAVTRQLQTRPGGAPLLAPPKTRRGRRAVALPETAVDAIRACLRWRKEQRLRLGPRFQDSGLLFCTPTGRALNPSNLRNRDHYPRLARLGLPRVRPHDLRHLHATALAEAGVDPATLAARLGHADAAFTYRRYVHPSPQAQAKAAGIAEALLLKPRRVRRRP